MIQADVSIQRVEFANYALGLSLGSGRREPGFIGQAEVTE